MLIEMKGKLIKNSSLKRIFLVSWLWLMLVIIGTITMSLSGNAVAPSGLTAEDADHLAGLRVAALHMDRTKIPAMLAALKEDNPSAVVSGLHALALLGATQALPAINQIVKSHLDSSTVRYAVAARARLLAEAEGDKYPPGSEQNNAKINTFLSQIGLTSSQITSGVTTFYQSPQEQQQGWTEDVYAMEEIADMAYRSQSSTFLSLPELQGLDFSRDPGSALKVELARMPQKQRLPWMVNELSHEQKRNGKTSLLMQLVIDEGIPASHASAEKLGEMKQNRSEYPYTGFSALFDVFRGIGDQKQAAVIALFLHDSDDWVSYYAQQSYPVVQSGCREQTAVGY